MRTQKRKADFFETEAGMEYIAMLEEMVADDSYNTEPSFSANSELYPNHQIPFVNKHIDYLKSHPSMDPQQYLANLRLMTRRRGNPSA